MFIFIIVKIYCIGAAINSARSGATDKIDTDNAAFSLEKVSENINIKQC